MNNIFAIGYADADPDGYDELFNKMYRLVAENTPGWELTQIRYDIDSGTDMPLGRADLFVNTGMGLYQVTGAATRYPSNKLSILVDLDQATECDHT